MKRIVSLILLVSMMLHCASRLGVISYLYQQRHQIAYQAGLIAEIPIAICNSDHDFSGELKIQHNDNDEKLPPVFAPAHEILLFLQEVNFEFNPHPGSGKSDFTLYRDVVYLHQRDAVFHPPCLG